MIAILTFFSVSFRLALYVYEYLLHVGAQKAAQTFLSEVSANHLLEGANAPSIFLLPSLGTVFVKF